jgi:hypothetical protein
MCLAFLRAPPRRAQRCRAPAAPELRGDLEGAAEAELTRAACLVFVMSSPFIRMRLSSAQRPVSMLTKVVLPAPFGR